jgi:IS5 family transposase
MRYEKMSHFSDEQFKRYCGVKRVLFNEMVEVLEQAERAKRKPGRPSKLSVADQVLLTLQYWREYRTLFHVAASFGLHESSAQRIVSKVERRLLDSGRFNLPNRHRALALGEELELVLVDASETPIERPKKKQRRYYSGKKKRHTLKAQLLIEPSSGVVLSSAFAAGPCHDKVLCTQQPVRLDPRTHCGADLGYQGLAKVHALTWLPFKATKHHPLNDEQRAYNRALARIRIKVEHVIRSLKIFRILAERYRNRRRRFSLRLNLIAGLYNRSLRYS